MAPPTSVDIHAHDVPERVDVVTKRLRLGRADQRRILGATAARLLRLG